MQIQNAIVYLVPFAEKHLNDEKYLLWLRDQEVIKYIGREEYFGEIFFDEIKKYVTSVWENKYVSFWAVYLSEYNKFIGTVKINYFNEAGLKSKTADIGIMIGERSIWGKGIAGFTLSLVCEYGFNQLSARKLTAGALANNIAVIKAFKKIGFVEEGRIRSRLLIGGEYHDHVLMGCFPNEFRGIPKHQ
jgi:ribosomal-protein-alanine N-acetyltransferase